MARRRSWAQQPRTKRLHPRLSPDEDALIQRKADQEGKAPSAWLAEVGVQAATEPLPPTDRQALAELIDLRRQVRAIGHNLNHLLAVINSRRELRMVAARSLLVAVGQVVSQLGRVVGKIDAAVDRLRVGR